MGLLSGILGLPLAPVRGVIQLGEVIRRRVDEEMVAPASIRRELEEAGEMRSQGRISGDEEAAIQHEVLRRLDVTEPAGRAEADEKER